MFVEAFQSIDDLVHTVRRVQFTNLQVLYLLEAIRRRWPCQRLRVADRGLREGILMELMSADKEKLWGQNITYLEVYCACLAIFFS